MQDQPAHLNTVTFIGLTLLLTTPKVTGIIKAKPADAERETPFKDNLDFYQSTTIGPYWDVDHDILLHDYIYHWDLLQIELRRRAEIYANETAHFVSDDLKYHQYDYRKVVRFPKYPNKPFKTLADWYLYFKGSPLSLTAACVTILPIIIAGLIQRVIEYHRSNHSELNRRTWEFPLVPVLFLQQTRREFMLRKKTVRRFCIQWEVGRINIRMDTRLVDLRQILHPPKRQKKVHKYTTWRIMRLIVRFNAFLAARRAAQQRSMEQLLALQRKRMDTWQSKLKTTRYAYIGDTDPDSIRRKKSLRYSRKPRKRERSSYKQSFHGHSFRHM